MSLETIRPASKALANSNFSAIFPALPKIPSVSALTAFSGTCSRTSMGTYKASKAPKRATVPASGKRVALNINKGALAPVARAFLMPFLAALV